MKRVARYVMMIVGLGMTTAAQAQSKVDEERMERDIEIAENVLGTLIKQTFEAKRTFFPVSVEGSYAPGYGVTFRVPAQIFNATIWATGAEEIRAIDAGGFSYSFSTNQPDEDIERELARQEATVAKRRADVKAKRAMSADSAKLEYDNKLIEAAKNFIADYGDLISQLPSDERIVVTNRSAGQRLWVGSFVNGLKQSYLSVEGTRGEVTQLKQGKLSRDQFMAKLRVVNSEMEDELHPDRELLSSIFNRLYRSDLSRTFYANESVYYEGLKDFGVIYYMKVYSSNQDAAERYSMPTVRLKDIDQETRDKKVKELYPLFDKSIKEDIVEYGRTLKSVDNNESLIFNVTLTKCVDCGIPSFVEYSVKGSVLSDYSAGKISKEAAVAKITMKKGPNQ